MQTISTGPKSQEEMIQEFKVNTDFREPKKMTTNTRQSQQKQKKIDGTTEPIILDMWQTDIDWQPKYGTMIPEWSVELIETLLKEPRQPIEIQETGKEQLMGGLMWNDLHIDERDVNNNTLKNRMNQTNERTKRVLDRLMRFDMEKLLVTQMGDLFNSDKGYRTSSGKVTVQNNTNEKDAFKKVMQWTLQQFEELKKLGIPLEYRVIGGNHDELVSQHYGVACEYALGVPVKVDKNRSYIQWGDTLIVLGHGDNEKPNNLLQLTTNEFLTKYKNTIKNLHGYLANQHRVIIGQNGPMIIKNLLAPNTRGDFSADKGHHMIEGMHGFVRDKKDGEIAEVRG